MNRQDCDVGHGPESISKSTGKRLPFDLAGQRVYVAGAAAWRAPHRIGMLLD